jgi:hypothetical protein
MYSFVIVSNPIKLFKNDWLFHNETVTNVNLDVPYYDDKAIHTQDMNFTSPSAEVVETATTTEATTLSSANFSMSVLQNVDKKFIPDIGNVTLAISKVRLLC